MIDARTVKIITEELELAQNRIIERIKSLGSDDSNEGINSPDDCISGGNQAALSRRAFPNPEKYQLALEIYQIERNHSRVARELGITINAAKKYYTWLVKNGYLPPEKAELSEAEKRVVHCIFEKEMSLTAAAKELHCSVTNIVRRRDSAISKGYVPPVPGHDYSNSIK